MTEPQGSWYAWWMVAVLVLTCLLGWGLWGICESKALQHGTARDAIMVQFLVYGLVGFVLRFTRTDPQDNTPALIGWSVLATLCSVAAIAAFLGLVPRVGPSVAVALTCGYPVVTALVAGGLGPVQWIGLGIAVLGIGLVAL